MEEALVPRRLLLIVTGDPRTDGRVAEAIRFAAGVTAWQKADVTLFLGGDAVQALLAGENQFVDEDNIVDFLPLLAEHKQELFVEGRHPLIAAIRDQLPCRELDVKQLAALAARHDCVMRF